MKAHFVNYIGTSAYGMDDYVTCEVEQVQDEHLWLKSIYICIFLRK